jgi:hypothetical protein
MSAYQDLGVKTLINGKDPAGLTDILYQTH